MREQADSARRESVAALMSATQRRLRSKLQQLVERRRRAEALPVLARASELARIERDSQALRVRADMLDDAARRVGLTK